MRTGWMRLSLAALLCASCWRGFDPVAASDFVAMPESSNVVGVLEDNETFLEFAFGGWGPNWQWLGFRGEVTESGKESRLTTAATVRASRATLRFDVPVRRSGPRQLQFDLNLRTDRDTELTCAIVSLSLPERTFAGGRALVVENTGETRTVELPLGRQGLGSGVKRFTLVDAAGRQTVISLDPACDVASDGEARIILAGEHFKADQPCRVTMTVDFPGDLTYYAGPSSVPEESGLDQWYVFQPTHDYDKPSEIDLTHWLDAPAGKHGRIVRNEDELIYNGQPIRLWGLNVCYSSCAPDKELADRRAKFYARYGVNTVRLHKYADGPGWAGIQSEESFVEFDSEALDRMDYFVAQLKRHGIYVLLSSTFGVKLGPKDRQYVPYMYEFGTGRNRVSTGHGSVFLSRELQDLQIQQIVEILKHRNPYTGLTYANDPAVAVVELFNEDSALFFGTLSQLQKIPTLRKRASEQFCDWLATRYASESALVDAWGKGALNSFGNEGITGESWEKKSIVPAGNPWFYDPDQLAGSQLVKRRRMFDTMLFLYDIQNEFYSRYVRAIRNTGYDGEILSSNWQAGRAFSHYYNLHSDYLVGMIDRHNYFGGGSGGKINNVSMLRIPGSGMLSSGMQQVADRPFMLSEWIHVSPNEWGVEGPAIIGAYGMGLQGWDVSYMFQNRDDGGFRNEIGKDQWEVSAPQVMGVFPAVARQVLRGDVRESDISATRYVHVESMHAGKLEFEDRVTQQHDVKTFDSDRVPAQTMAVARSVVAFTDEYRQTPAFDISRYQRGDVFVSTTEQLRWKEGASKLDGFFSIDTDATKAVIGFAGGRRCELDSVTITPECRFGVVYVTAQEKNGTIASSKSLLVVAIARARNTAMKVFNDCRLLDRGESPVVMEPVKAAISIRRNGQPTVHVLDHDGCRTGKTLPVSDGEFEIDGARDKTCYYLVTY